MNIQAELNWIRTELVTRRQLRQYYFPIYPILSLPAMSKNKKRLGTLYPKRFSIVNINQLI
jgi:hypothetical protein